MNELLNNKSRPAARRRRKTAEKPPMPPSLKAEAEKTIKRHARRHRSPGVAVEVEKVSETGYVVGSPHSDLEAWEAMVCDALGTRSIATAKTFLFQLTELCTQNWHPSEDGQSGEWCPDERELNMILNVVAGIKPKNEMQAALAAQMVAVHLMQMRLSARALGKGYIVPEDAAIAGKLARTFAMQIDALSRLKGKRSSSKQTITVRQEKHVHHHQHAHFDGGGSEIRAQPHEAGGAGEPPKRAPLPCPKQDGEIVPFPSDEGQEGLSAAWRDKPRRARG